MFRRARLNSHRAGRALRSLLRDCCSEGVGRITHCAGGVYAPNYVIVGCAVLHGSVGIVCRRHCRCIQLLEGCGPGWCTEHGISGHRVGGTGRSIPTQVDLIGNSLPRSSEVD